MLEKLELLAGQFEKLQEIIRFFDQYGRYFTVQNLIILCALIGFLFILSALTCYVVLKKKVQEKIDDELNKRLFLLIEKNPPVFFASGTGMVNTSGHMYIDPDIPGIDQLNPDTVLKLDIRQNGAGLKGAITELENEVIELSVKGPYNAAELIEWKLIWPRSKYTL